MRRAAEKPRLLLLLHKFWCPRGQSRQHTPQNSFPNFSWNASFHQDPGFSLLSTGSRRTEGFVCLFFQESHRKASSGAVCCRLSCSNTTQNSFWTGGKTLPNRGGEETGAAAPIKAFAYTFPTWVLPKKGGIFAKKIGFLCFFFFLLFDPGMATTVENLSGITNCSL